jgi:hypothetical protein
MIRLSIFEVILFEDDALEFCSKTKKEKTDWIKENTNQTSNFLIKEFVDNVENSVVAQCKSCKCK